MISLLNILNQIYIPEVYLDRRLWTVPLTVPFDSFCFLSFEERDLWLLVFLQLMEISGPTKVIAFGWFALHGSVFRMVNLPRRKKIKNKKNECLPCVPSK